MVWWRISDLLTEVGVVARRLVFVQDWNVALSAVVAVDARRATISVWVLEVWGWCGGDVSVWHRLK